MRRLISVIFILTLIRVIIPATSLAYIGGRDVGTELPATVKLSTLDSDCTGVKISEKYVLTAAHCTLLGGYSAGDTVTIMNRKGQRSEGDFIESRIIKTHLHPSFRWGPPNEKFDFADLAIIEFENLIIFETAKIATTPVVMNEKILVGGFGKKGKNYPRLPQLTVAFKTVEGLLGTAFFSGIMDADGTDMSFGAVGDSGGPVYRWSSQESEWQIVGINSVVNTSYNAFEIDEATGRILKFTPERIGTPHFYFTRLAFPEGEDTLGIYQWIMETIKK